MTLFGNNRVFLIYLTAMLFFSSISQGIENKIVLKINEKIITSLDINREINYLSALNPKIKKLKKEKLLEIAKNSIIKEKIKELEIKKYVKNIVIDEKYLSDLIKSTYLRLGFNNEKEFIKYIETYDLNLDQIKNKINIEANWNELIFAKYSNKIKVSKDELRTRIIEENNKKNKIYLLSEILFDVSDNQTLEKKYKNIKKNISEIGFENSALNYSKSDSSNSGGKLGWISEKLLNKKIREHLNKIKIGEITDPIVTPGGFLILLLENVKFEKNKKNIDQQLNNLIKKETNNQLNQYSNIHFKKVKKDLLIDEL